MHGTFSLAELMASLSEAQRREALEGLSESQCEELLWDWRFYARPKQLAPEGDWSVWNIRAGRGFGKTRSGAGWVQERAMEFPGRWCALVARTPADARDYMIEGPGGFVRNVKPADRPHYEPSKRRLTWPNGSWATIYSDEEPDQLRGFSGDTAWLDEFAKFKNAEAGWDNLQFGMREVSNDQPRVLITSTPRPLAILKRIEAAPGTITVIGTSRENRANLDPTWYNKTLASYKGTRTGRQEIEAEILDEVQGALWTRTMIDQAREPIPKLPDMQRVLVGVDPSGTKGVPSEVRKDPSKRRIEEKAGDDVGIVVAGRGVDGRCYILGDYTVNLSPRGWARQAVQVMRGHQGDGIVAEINYGGAMVEYVIKSFDPTVSVKVVTASRGKVVRAEPVAALYEQGRVSHDSNIAMPALEDQMCAFTSLGYVGEGSPDRADALVWVVTELMLEGSGYSLENI